MTIFLMVIGVISSTEDVRFGRISRILLLSGIAGILCYKFFFIKHFFINSLTGCVIGLIVFYLARVITKGKLGLGDIWVSGFIGACLGMYGWFLSNFISCVVAFLFIIIFNKNKIPFVPFLFGGAILTVMINHFFGLTNYAY
jgi:leader peptidase (prepilin peptidase) / N-methyltransferase